MKSVLTSEVTGGAATEFEDGRRDGELRVGLSCGWRVVGSKGGSQTRGHTGTHVVGAWTGAGTKDTVKTGQSQVCSDS